ncbi:MAG: hypothetical protein H6810_09865 [Phycisphaeraceae bacterium]|nr:MAG: hypothetical protein H6810_09865 [Phycisphaeraceae bacterium]
MRRHVFALVVLSALVSVGLAGPYDGMRLVKVWTDSATQREMVGTLPMLLMSEAERTHGGTEYLADEATLRRLDAAGVVYLVEVEDMQKVVDTERARLDARVRWGVGPAPRGDDTFFTEFRDPAEIAAFLDQLVAAHPGIVSREAIGTSLQGRTIEAFTISGAGDPDSKRSLVFNGTIHAREWISPTTVLYMMQQLADGYGSDPRITALLDRVTYRIIPVLNPDGYDYTWTTYRMWRKNLRNGYGVDLNRNFSEGWGGPGSSGSHGSETYRGSSPFSEPESRVLRDYMLGVPNLAAHIDYHSFSQLVMWPPGDEISYLPPPDGTVFEQLGRDYRNAIHDTTGARYKPQRIADLYLASGNTADWGYVQAGSFSWAVELRPPSAGGTFAPPPTEILPCAQENLAGALVLGEAVADGVLLTPIETPTLTEPETPVDVVVEVDPAFLRTLDGVSIDLFVRTGEGSVFAPVAMSGDNYVFTTTLPGVVCGTPVDYYAEVATPEGVTLRYPEGGADDPVSLTVVRTRSVLTDDMETDTGWTAGVPGDTATTGVWELAEPVVSQDQPGEDHTPNGTLCWITEAARTSNLHDSDVNGVTTLISPAYDLSTTWDEHFLSFWLWYNTYDEPLEIGISADNGQTFEPLDVVTETTGDWVYRSYALPADFGSSRAFRVRFVATDEGSSSLIEAAVDDLAIYTVGCGLNPADLAEPFGVLDVEDITAFITAFLGGDPAADLAPPQGVIDLHDLTAFIGFFLQGSP